MKRWNDFQRKINIFRQINVFTEEVTKLISRNCLSVIALYSTFLRCVLQNWIVYIWYHGSEKLWEFINFFNCLYCELWFHENSFLIHSFFRVAYNFGLVKKEKSIVFFALQYKIRKVVRIYFCRVFLCKKIDKSISEVH